MFAGPGDAPVKSDCRCHSHNGLLLGSGTEPVAQAVEKALRAGRQRAIVDIPCSVSGSRRDEITMIFDDGVLDEQHRRFLDVVEVEV